MRNALLALVMLGLAAGAIGCTAAQAKAPVNRPALEVPPPPPRVIEPLVPEPSAPMEPVADLPPPPVASSSRPRPQPPRDAASKEAAKPEPKPEAVPPTETVAPPTTPTSNPAPPQIRTPADNSETARQVRDILDRANKTLASIDYRPLSLQRKESYDTAKRFILQAEDAIKASNFHYARFLADKADILAKELQGR